MLEKVKFDLFVTEWLQKQPLNEVCSVYGYV